MNFENYKGKLVRINTNIIDEKTNEDKVIEGIYEGCESLGNSHYFIVNGINYPEMCIKSWGLIPEKVADPITNKIVEDAFVPAFTLQVDPLDMIDKSIDGINSTVEEKGVSSGFLRLISPKLITKIGSLLMLFIFIASISAVISFKIPSTNEHRYDISNNLVISDIKDFNFSLDNNKVMCNSILHNGIGDTLVNTGCNV